MESPSGKLSNTGEPMESPPIFREISGGLLEYCGPTDDTSLAVEKWRELDASIDIGIWGQASIAAAIVPKYSQDDIGKFAEAVEKAPCYVRRMAKTYRYFIVENDTRVSNLSFKHHSVALRHSDPEAALMRASENGWSCVKLEEWILNEAVVNVSEKRAIKQERQNDFRQFLESVDAAVLDFMATCPNAEWGKRVFRGWRDDVAWELSQIARAEVSDRVVDAMESGARTVSDIKAATGLRATEIESVIALRVAEGTWEWVRKGGETEMARGLRQSQTILHIVGTAVAV
jgi:hypothetical protein